MGSAFCFLTLQQLHVSTCTKQKYLPPQRSGQKPWQPLCSFRRMHTVDRAQDFSFSQTSSTLRVSQSQMWSPFYSEVQPLPSFPLQHIAGLPDLRLGADISFSSPLPSVYLQKGEGRYYVIRIPNQPIQFIQADKEIREEKEKKKIVQAAFFFPFPPPLSNINVLSPQTHLWMHFHVPPTNQRAEISKLQSQAPNKGFKRRTAHGTSRFNLPLLQLHNLPPPHLGDPCVLQ